MQFPRLPDWAVYAAVVGVLLAVSLSRRENADAPPPQTDAREGPLLGLSLIHISEPTRRS